MLTAGGPLWAVALSASLSFIARTRVKGLICVGCLVGMSVVRHISTTDRSKTKCASLACCKQTPAAMSVINLRRSHCVDNTCGITRKSIGRPCGLVFLSQYKYSCIFSISMLHYCLFEKSVFKFLHYKWMSVISLSQFGVRRAGGSRIVPSTRV